MRNKFTQLLICDPWLTLRMMIILLLAIVISVQQNMLKGWDQKYAKALQEQALVSRIKEMERSLKSSQDKTAQKTVKNGFSFEGYIAEGSDSYAIIDSNVYRVGDRIRDYRVAKINTDSVILEHTQTGEQEILRLNIPQS